MEFLSWGRYPRVTQQGIWINSRKDLLPQHSGTVLPFGQGRSYGDSCLNDGGTLLLTERLRNIFSFNRATGVITVEAGITFDELLSVIVPAGWFLPVSPGTRFVSVGGAIANDIHGKNHHRGGCFGNHLQSFEVLKSSGERLQCSATENQGLFSATIGGLGLTGFITAATFTLVPITNPYIDEESFPFRGLARFYELSEESHAQYDFTVAWVDCLAKTPRGIFMRGNFNTNRGILRHPRPRRNLLPFPIEAPSFLLNSLSIQIFNELYFHRIPKNGSQRTVPYEPFFYPLDAAAQWNRMYGKRGFLQWQCVVPIESGAIDTIFKIIAESREGSFLAVLKTFGEIKSPGMLSFPRPGVTLALDFAIKGEKTFALLNKLDDVVRHVGGGLYPAKDARMSKEMFLLSAPRLHEFLPYKDPGFSSSFFRRVVDV